MVGTYKGISSWGMYPSFTLRAFRNVPSGLFEPGMYTSPVGGIDQYESHEVIEKYADDRHSHRFTVTRHAGNHI